MKRTITILMACICIMAFSACSSKKARPKPQWLYKKDALTLRFKADPVLNMYDSLPHTLMVCVYQVRSETVLDRLSNNEDGIYQLLDCESFDSSIRSAKRLIIHPGQDLTFVMDRLAGARKIGFVAGYSKLEKGRILRFVDIPTMVEDRDTAVARDMKIVINLGAEQIAAIHSY